MQVLSRLIGQQLLQLPVVVLGELLFAFCIFFLFQPHSKQIYPNFGVELKPVTMSLGITGFLNIRWIAFRGVTRPSAPCSLILLANLVS